MKQLKIAIIGPAHPYRGGMAAFNERLGRELQQQGHEVELINFVFQYPNWIFPGEKQTTDDPAPDDLAISRKIHSISPLNWFKVRSYLKRQRYDRIFCGYWLPLLSPCFSSILKGLKKKTQITGIIHNAIPHEKRTGDHSLTAMFLGQLSDAVVLSKSVEKDLKTFELPAELNILSLFHPIYDQYGKPVAENRAKEELGLDTSKRYLLFFGFIRSYKGLDILIEAFGHANLPGDVDLLIAGEFYEDREQYLKSIQESEVSSRIHLKEGYIPSERVKFFFCAAKAVVLPYRSATQSGITQIAIHFSVPVISTRVGGIEEYIRHDYNGLLTSSDSAVLASDLSGLFERNPFDRYVKAQKEILQKYSWKAFVEAL